MDALSLLLNRRSCAQLVEPAPQHSALDNILQAGMRAPDHGGLTPWHFTLVKGDGRQKLADIFYAALQQDNASENELKKALKAPFRAPLIIMVTCTVKPHPKVPDIEQLLAAGCCVQAMQMAAVAQGYQGIWRTGAFAYHPMIKQGLGLAAAEHIIGYLYLGSAAKKAASVKPMQLQPHVSQL